MREIILSELVKEVMGPRNGVKEELNDNPLEEFVTGVLSPPTEEDEPDPDKDLDSLPREEDAESKDIEADDDHIPPISPHGTIIDPKSPSENLN